jgi:ethanolamine utilization protein EutN
VSVLNQAGQVENVSGSPDMLVVWDDLGAGIGSHIAVSDGGEAAQPFRPDFKAVDAYCSAILDHLHIDQNAIGKLKTSN